MCVSNRSNPHNRQTQSFLIITFQAALSLAEKLIELGAIPLTFTDHSGTIYEPNGFDMAKLRSIQRIKQDRGARVGKISDAVISEI